MNPLRPWVLSEGGEDMSDNDGEAMLKLTLIVDGQPRTWTENELSEVEVLTVPGKKGERDAWSLRTIATELAGSGAVVTRVVGEAGMALDLPAEHWANEQMLPVLRLNRKFLLKFLWLNPDLSRADAEQRREVSEIHFTTLDKA
jgi:hypothetical protein